MIKRRLALVLTRQRLGLPTFPSSSQPSPIHSFNWPSCGCRFVFLTPIRLSSSGAAPPPPPQLNRYNHYETLGVAEDATPQDIKKAFYSLSKRCHPDLHPDDERMAEKFKALTTAYEVLIDQDKRRAYDVEKNIRRSNQKRWHGYSSNKYYPVAKGERPQVSYTTADVSRRKSGAKSRRFDSHLGDLSDSDKDEWIRQQHKKMKERLEEEDRQFKDEWKQMMGSRSDLTPGEPGFRPDSLTEEERKRWEEFQNKLEERRKEVDRELAFQNQRIAQHPVLYYFYNMKYDWVEWTLWPLGLIGGLLYIAYVLWYKDPEEMPYRTMRAQFEEEGRLHKLKMAEKKERQRQVEALIRAQEEERRRLELMRQRSLQKVELERETKPMIGVEDDDYDYDEDGEEDDEEEEEDDDGGVQKEEIIKDGLKLTGALIQNIDVIKVESDGSSSKATKLLEFPSGPLSQQPELPRQNELQPH